MRGVAGRQLRKVRQSPRHSWVLRGTLILAGSWRAMDKVKRPGQHHLRASYPKQTNTVNLRKWSSAVMAVLVCGHPFNKFALFISRLNNSILTNTSVS